MPEYQKMYALLPYAIKLQAALEAAEELYLSAEENEN